MIEPGPVAYTDRGLRNVASRIYASRRRRDRTFGADLFGEPAWDLLLDLFAQDEAHAIGVSSAALAAAVPMTTAFRWISDLVDRALVERTPDPADRRRIQVRLTATGRDLMAKHLRELLDALHDGAYGAR